jgi:hypothetical protein
LHVTPFLKLTSFILPPQKWKKLRDEYRKKYLILYLINLFIKIIYIIKIDKNKIFIK